MLSEALDLRVAAYGGDHRLVARSLNNLAALLWDLGDYAGARPLYERALAIEEASRVNQAERLFLPRHGFVAL